MKAFVKVMKALSDPNRVRILKLLQIPELCFCEFVELLQDGYGTGMLGHRADWVDDDPVLADMVKKMNKLKREGLPAVLSCSEQKVLSQA